MADNPLHNLSLEDISSKVGIKPPTTMKRYLIIIGITVLISAVLTFLIIKSFTKSPISDEAYKAQMELIKGQQRLLEAQATTINQQKENNDKVNNILAAQGAQYLQLFDRSEQVTHQLTQFLTQIRKDYEKANRVDKFDSTDTKRYYADPTNYK
jgi:hypothetical protein